MTRQSRWVCVGILGVVIISLVERQTVNPRYASVHGEMGQKAQRKKQWRRAEKYYQQAVQDDPFFADGFYRLGLLYKRRADYPQAAEYLQRAVAMQPMLAEAFDQLGLTLLALGAYPRARLAFEKALALNAGDIDRRKHVIMACWKMQDEAEAQTQLHHLRVYHAEALADQLQTLSPVDRERLITMEWQKI